MKDLAEVCPLSRGVMLQLLSTPLQDDFRFFRIPLPTVPSACLAAAYRNRGTVGLPCSAYITEWVRSALFAGGVSCPRGRRNQTSYPPRCLLAQASQPL